jgi:hypothetical protein
MAAKPNPSFAQVSIPAIDQSIDPAVGKVLQALKQAIEVREGRAGSNERFMTVNDLYNAGVLDLVINGVRVTGAGSAAGGFVASTFNNTSVPPAVTGIATAGGLGKVFITWNDIDDSAVSHVQIWRSADDDFSNAVVIGTSTVAIYADEDVDSGEIFYYWLKAISPRGIAGPLNDVAGTPGEASYDPKYVNDLLRIKWEASQIYSLNEYIIPTPSAETGLWYKATVAGYSGTAQPTWPTIVGGTVVDNEVIWEAVASAAQEATFLVGDVNGVPSVVVNGNLYADGTIVARMVQAGAITADKITASQLSAISADLGNITAGSLNINDRFNVNSSGAVTISSATTGARMEIQNNVLKVYDTSGILRVQIGDLSA